MSIAQQFDGMILSKYGITLCEPMYAMMEKLRDGTLIYMSISRDTDYLPSTALALFDCGDGWCNSETRSNLSSQLLSRHARQYSAMNHRI